MESSGQRTKCLLLFSLIVVCAQSVFVEPQGDAPMRSLTETETRLPCHYQAKDDENVVQVTWYKVLADGTKDQIITAHFSDGYTEFGRYSGRVRFESSSPTANSALIILNTEVSDGGAYACRISTFPNGNFERHINLVVWSLPISSLDPVTLVEGESFRVAASCRAVGHPLPRLSWDTDLPGQSQNRTGEGGSVTTHFSLHPLRSMNGKKLDCLVWHPGLEKPRRITNRLVVQYPPDATITAASGDLYVGLDKAELTCSSRGFPKPETITWTWRGGALPDGATVIGEKLVFGRVLRKNDTGVYECVVKNDVGVGKADYTLNVSEKVVDPKDNLLLIIIAALAAGLVMILVIVILLVNRHHRHRNQKLERELDEKTEEINSLSRHTSFRRLNSFSSDPRAQSDDYVLRVDSRMKHSAMSLERQMHRESQIIMNDRWGNQDEVELDELGRPVIWDGSRERMRGAEKMDEVKEERRRFTEAYVMKNSNMSLDSGLPSSLTPMKPQQDDGSPRPRESDFGCLLTPEEEQDADDDSHASNQIAAALSNHFDYINGVLRPKPHPNSILLQHRPQVI